jgi:hypothetical protein
MDGGKAGHLRHTSIPMYDAYTEGESMAKTKTTKRENAKATDAPARSRVTCWLSATALHKLELAVVDRKMKTGKRDVEYGDVLEEMLLEKFSSLTLVHRGPRPTADAETTTDPAPIDPDTPTSQPENP